MPRFVFISLGDNARESVYDDFFPIDIKLYKIIVTKLLYSLESNGLVMDFILDFTRLLPIIITHRRKQ